MHRTDATRTPSPLFFARTSSGRNPPIRFRDFDRSTTGKMGSASGSRAFSELWESFHVEIGEITEPSENQVFFETWLTARGAASGVETEIHNWSVTWHRTTARSQGVRFFGPGTRPSKLPGFRSRRCRRRTSRSFAGSTTP